MDCWLPMIHDPSVKSFLRNRINGYNNQTIVDFRSPEPITEDGCIVMKEVGFDEFRVFV